MCLVMSNSKLNGELNWIYEKILIRNKWEYLGMRK